MKSVNLTKKFTFIGLGAGIVFFIIYGLLPGSLIGGVIGLKLASLLLGIPAPHILLSRMIVAICILFGVMTTGFIFIVGSSMIGWFSGYIIFWLLNCTKKKIRAG